MASVALEKVSKIFRDRRNEVRAVRSLCLDVADGEFMVLVGPSGCGKTTTLRLIAGLDELSEGTIRIDGQDVGNVAPRHRDVAMVFQNYALYPHMTVFKNMAFALKMRHESRAQIKRKVHSAAATLGLSDLLDRKPAALSGGEKQRVALGRAVVRNPKVFLFDEPLSNLDASLRLRMRTELRELHRRLGATILHVTHEQEEAMTLGDRLAVLDRGVIRQCGRPMDVYERPADRFVAGFLGSPPMNLVEMEVGSSGGATTLMAASHPICLTNKLAGALSRLTGNHVCVGIRPEHVLIGRNDVVEHSSSAGEELVSFGPMKVDLVEPLGDRVRVHLAGSGLRFIATGSIDDSPTTGEVAQVSAAVSRIHFFETGELGTRINVAL